ncbi:MAG: LXG domain-containing protein [Clostridium sp.]|nr:LXG domain-containing protein [Clostridium sp.]
MRVAFVDLVSADNYVVQKKIEWDAMLEDLVAKITAFVNLESFQGEAADCAKVYMYEMHSYIIAQMKMYINEVMSKFTIYVGEYLTLDTSAVAVLDTFTLNLCANNMSMYSGFIETDESQLRAVVANISDLYTAPATSYSTVMSDFDTVGNDACVLSNTMALFDADEVAGAVETLEQYDLDIYRVIAEASGGNAVALGSYQSGDLAGFASYAASYENLQRSIVDISLEAERLSDAFEEVAGANQELQDIRALEEKEKNSLLHYVKGTGCFITAVSVIVLTDGAATPVVVGGLILAGGCTAFGASEYYEATNEVMNVIMNDPSAVAVNPIRDTIFCGDQEAYDQAMNITTTVASLYGGGVKAYQSAVEKGIEEVGEYVFISSVENYGQNLAKEAVFQGSVDAFEHITGIELDDTTEEIIKGIMSDADVFADSATGGYLPTIYN